ncbi:hypothetical protein J8J40_26990, partial [Mycobacterium tuberculosis]|nr:hypothetical protein [Mycobacterium tuberculosis]
MIDTTGPASAPTSGSLGAQLRADAGRIARTKPALLAGDRGRRSRAVLIAAALAAVYVYGLMSFEFTPERLFGG